MSSLDIVRASFDCCLLERMIEKLSAVNDDNDNDDDEIDDDDDDTKIVPYHPAPPRQVWSVNASVEQSTRRFKELFILMKMMKADDGVGDNDDYDIASFKQSTRGLQKTVHTLSSVKWRRGDMIWSWGNVIFVRYLVRSILYKDVEKGSAPPKKKCKKNHLGKYDICEIPCGHYKCLERGWLFLSLWIQSACIHSSGRKYKKSTRVNIKFNNWEMHRKSLTNKQ